MASIRLYSVGSIVTVNDVERAIRFVGSGRMLELVGYAFPADATAASVRDDVELYETAWLNTEVQSINIAANRFTMKAVSPGNIDYPTQETRARLHGNYLPLTEVAEASGFDLGTENNLVSTRTYASDAVHDAFDVFASTGKSFSITFSGFYLTDGGAISLTAVPESFVFLIQLGSGAQVRGTGKTTREQRAGGIDALQTTELELTGNGSMLYIT